MATKIVTGAAKAPRATKKTAPAPKTTERKKPGAATPGTAAQAAAATPPAPPSPPIDSAALDFSEADSLNCSLKNLLCLTEWIERARHLIWGVQFVAGMDEGVAEEFRRWNVGVADGDWDLAESCGLREVQMLIYEKASKLGTGAVALARSHDGREVPHG